jgi:hypothetical protein
MFLIQSMLLRDIFDLFNLGHFDPINPVFPKVRSADHLWSARFSILVRKKFFFTIHTKKLHKCVLKSIFSAIYSSIYKTKIIFLVRRAMY